MSRYIDAEEFEKYINREEWKTPDEKWWPEREIGIIMDAMPTADVKEVVHGEWKANKLFGFKIFDCSNCGIHIETRWNYCPHCGARMDGGR